MPFSPRIVDTIATGSFRPLVVESFARFRNPLVLLALVLAQTLSLAVQVQRPAQPGFAVGDVADSPKVTLLRSWMMFLAGPIERSAQATGSGVRHLWANYVDLRHTHQQNVALRDEVVRLRQEQVSFAEDAAEGRRLQALLEFKQKYITSTVAAEVIGASGSDRSHVLWINKGYADGLEPEQPVITPDGAVGKLRDVQTHTAQVLLLSDTNSGAGVFLESTRMRAILRGTAAGEVVINNLTPDERIKLGEKVITSGGDQVFPRGLPVGVITSIVADPQHPPYTLIAIKPAANLRQLEEVLVITGTQTNLPASAQADAAQAETAAEEDKRASELIAERLPSLHQDPATTTQTDSATQASSTDSIIQSAAQGSGPVSGVPNSGMPKPAVHPDRYSPGSTPPANNLTPGAPAPPPDRPATEPQAQPQR